MGIHWGLCPRPPGEGSEGKGTEEERGREGEEGIIHLLLPQAHTAVVVCVCFVL